MIKSAFDSQMQCVYCILSVQVRFISADDMMPTAIVAFKYKLLRKSLEIYLFRLIPHPVMLQQNLIEPFTTDIISYAKLIYVFANSTAITIVE